MTPTDLGRKYVPQIFTRVIAGESRATVAAWLNSEGVTTPGGHASMPAALRRNG